MHTAAESISAYLSSAPVGEASRIARASGVPASHVSEYVRGKRKVPAAKAVVWERETCGAVLREHLRADWADLWPDLIPLRRIEETAAAE